MVLKKKRTLKGENDFALSCPNEELCVGICYALKFSLFFKPFGGWGVLEILIDRGWYKSESQ